MAPGEISLWQFFVMCFLFQIVNADIDSTALQYIARRLTQSECQRIISEPFSTISQSSETHDSSLNKNDCFRKLVDWESNLRTHRRDVRLILGNRLHRNARDDLAALVVDPFAKGITDVAEEAVEYESWDTGKESSRKLMSSSAPSIPAKGRGMSPEFRQKLIRKLSGIRNLDGFKDRSMAMLEPDSEHSETLGGEYVTAETPGDHQSHEDVPETNIAPDKNDHKDSKPLSNSSANTTEGEKHDNNKLSKFFSHLSDDKNAPCLRVPLSTALVVIGTIMTLTCCCALLLRNRLAACFERLRGKKNKNKTSKRLSLDEEQGFMGPRTVGKAPKNSGRKGGGPIDETNVGIQDSNTASNGSIQSEEKPTGCCTCCTKKKKSNRRKRKK